MITDDVLASKTEDVSSEQPENTPQVPEEASNEETKEQKQFFGNLNPISDPMTDRAGYFESKRNAQKSQYKKEVMGELKNIGAPTVENFRNAKQIVDDRRRAFLEADAAESKKYHDMVAPHDNIIGYATGPFRAALGGAVDLLGNTAGIAKELFTGEKSDFSFEKQWSTYLGLQPRNELEAVVKEVVPMFAPFEAVRRGLEAVKATPALVSAVKALESSASPFVKALPDVANVASTLTADSLVTALTIPSEGETTTPKLMLKVLKDNHNLFAEGAKAVAKIADSLVGSVSPDDSRFDKQFALFKDTMALGGLLTGAAKLGQYAYGKLTQGTTKALELSEEYQKSGIEKIAEETARVAPEIAPQITKEVPDEISQFVQKKTKISAGRLAKNFGITVDEAQGHLSSLEQQGVITKANAEGFHGVYNKMTPEISSSLYHVDSTTGELVLNPIGNTGDTLEAATQAYADDTLEYGAWSAEAKLREISSETPRGSTEVSEVTKVTTPESGEAQKVVSEETPGLSAKVPTMADLRRSGVISTRLLTHMGSSVVGALGGFTYASTKKNATIEDYVMSIGAGVALANFAAAGGSTAFNRFMKIGTPEDIARNFKIQGIQVEELLENARDRLTKEISKGTPEEALNKIRGDISLLENVLPYYKGNNPTLYKGKVGEFVDKMKNVFSVDQEALAKAKTGDTEALKNVLKLSPDTEFTSTQDVITSIQSAFKAAREVPLVTKGYAEGKTHAELLAQAESLMNKFGGWSPEGTKELMKAFHGKTEDLAVLGEALKIISTKHTAVIGESAAKINSLIAEGKEVPEELIRTFFGSSEQIKLVGIALGNGTSEAARLVGMARDSITNSNLFENFKNNPEILHLAATMAMNSQPDYIKMLGKIKPTTLAEEAKQLMYNFMFLTTSVPFNIVKHTAGGFGAEVATKGIQAIGGSAIDAIMGNPNLSRFYGIGEGFKQMVVSFGSALRKACGAVKVGKTLENYAEGAAPEAVEKMIAHEQLMLTKDTNMLTRAFHWLNRSPINWGTKAIMFEDQFTKALSSSWLKGYQAVRYAEEASQRGLGSYSEIKEKVLRGLGPTDLIVSQNDLGSTLTATRELEGYLKTLNSVVVDNPVLNLMVPIFKAPLNEMRLVSQYIPGLGFFVNSSQANVSSIPREAKEEMIAKMVAGGAMMYYFWDHLDSWKISGSGFGKKLRTMVESGKAPYTMQYDEDRRFSYQKIGVVGTMMALMADAKELTLQIQRNPELANDADFQNKARVYTSSVATLMAKHLVPDGLQQGLLSVTDFMSSTDGEKSEESIMNFLRSGVVSRLVPGISRDLAIQFDSHAKQIKTLGDQVMSMIPGLRSKVRDRLDIYGFPEIEKDRTMLNLAVDNHDKLKNYMNQLNINVSPYLKQREAIGGIELNRKQHEFFAREAGKEILKRTMGPNSSFWKNFETKKDSIEQTRIIRDLLNKTNDIAMERLLSKSPKLKQKIEGNKRMLDERKRQIQQTQGVTPGSDLTPTPKLGILGL